MAAAVKTNAMRLLDQAGISYQACEYSHEDGRIDGVSVAEKLEQPVEQVFKTLVTQGASRQYYVFVIPVAGELDLKAAARAVDEKSVAMIPVADILKVTGYIRGGCSPLGMKKVYPTVLDQACLSLPVMMVSAGKIGHQIAISPQDLLAMTKAATAPLTLQ